MATLKRNALREEKELIRNVFEFDDITAGEIATHRTELSMLAIDDTHEEWSDIINNSRFSRYPVYGESVDDIIGILDARTYFRLEDKSIDNIVKTALRTPYLVPETLAADVLLRNMRTRKDAVATITPLEHSGRNLRPINNKA